MNFFTVVNTKIVKFLKNEKLAYSDDIMQMYTNLYSHHITWMPLVELAVWLYLSLLLFLGRERFLVDLPWEYKPVFTLQKARMGICTNRLPNLQIIWWWQLLNLNLRKYVGNNNAIHNKFGQYWSFISTNQLWVIYADLLSCNLSCNFY